jgi:hypothetical protein
VHRDGDIKVSFFGGLTIGRVGKPDRCDDNHVYIASLLDLAAQKMKVILVRAEPKDYVDIYALIKAGITLPDALGAAKALYPNSIPLFRLRHLLTTASQHLPDCPLMFRELLTVESAKVESIKTIPKSQRVSILRIHNRAQNPRQTHRNDATREQANIAFLKAKK